MMIINRDTKISEILKENMDAVDAIATINKNFLKLKNPFLRKMLAPRVTVASAVQIGNSKVNVLLKSLEEIGFQVEYDKEDNLEININEENSNNMSTEKIVDLDVRPVLDMGTDPFNVIMETLKTMNDDETLRIINTFEPIPLLNILKGKGYEYKSERPEEGIVHTFLWKSGEEKIEDEELVDVNAPDLSYQDLERKYDGRLMEIDVRDLEMPMPMVTILEAIETLEEGHALFVHHKRLPQYLLPELKQREFDYKAQEVDDDNMKLIIFRK
jgi:uncharacterized protein (DUF2249 family)